MKTIASSVALALAATIFWPGPVASAPETRRADPLDPKAPVPAQAYRSAFQGYRPNAGAELGSWAAANQAVHQAGGWRAYARESSATAEALAPAASAPGQAASQPAGHAHH